VKVIITYEENKLSYYSNFVAGAVHEGHACTAIWLKHGVEFYRLGKKVADILISI
jgi:hypothetical protein